MWFHEGGFEKSWKIARAERVLDDGCNMWDKVFEPSGEKRGGQVVKLSQLFTVICFTTVLTS